VKIKLQSLEKVLIATAILEVLAYYLFLYVGIPLMVAPTSLQILAGLWAVCAVATLTYSIVCLGIALCGAMAYLCEVLGVGDVLRGLIKWFTTDDRK
jgi:hypothetical protein